MPWTQVDAAFQIQNLPSGGSMQIDEYPISIGPIPVPAVLVNTDGGLVIDNDLAFDTLLASLTQQGVIGTLGGQSLAGPFYLVGSGANVLPPAFSTFQPSVVLQDGDLAWYVTSEGAITDPNASITYQNALLGPLLDMNCEGGLTLEGG